MKPRDVNHRRTQVATQRQRFNALVVFLYGTISLCNALNPALVKKKRPRVRIAFIDVHYAFVVRMREKRCGRKDLMFM